jgi:hypothetical protein
MILPVGMRLFALVQYNLRELDREWGIVACCKGKEEEEKDVNHGFWVTRCND